MSHQTPEPAADKPTIALFFPVYNDGHAIRGLTEKGDAILRKIASRYEIIIINDGSKDDSGAIADALAQKFDHVRVIHHPANRGYGEALKTGFAHVGDFDWICFTDGDHQYDISELYNFAPHLNRYDMILGYRVRKTYGLLRKILSFGLNSLVRFNFGTRFRDITCGFKMVRRQAMQGIQLTSASPFAGGEVAVRVAFKGYAVGEVAISMYPRQVGQSNIVSWRAIRATYRDLRRVRADLFRNQPRGNP